MRSVSVVRAFSDWLEKYDDAQEDNTRSYVNPRTGIIDRYQLRFDDMLAACEFGVEFQKALNKENKKDIK